MSIREDKSQEIEITPDIYCFEALGKIQWILKRENLTAEEKVKLIHEVFDNMLE